MAITRFPNIPVPHFELVGDWRVAKKVPLRVQKLLVDSYSEWSVKYANKLLKELRSYIGTGRVPPGVHWLELKEMEWGHKMKFQPYYHRTGRLKRALGIRTSRKGYVQVGLINPRQRASRGNISLTTLLKILQNGSANRHIRGRPLFAPVFKNMGGTSKMKKELIQYIYRKCKGDPFVSRCELKVNRYR